jgi:hypothetical protein
MNLCESYGQISFVILSNTGFNLLHSLKDAANVVIGDETILTIHLYLTRIRFRVSAYLAHLLPFTIKLISVHCEAGDESEMERLSAHIESPVPKSILLKLHLTLAVHDHIIRATGQYNTLVILFFYFCAAYDTNDHSILLDRCSPWFGISSIALNWIERLSHLIGLSGFRLRILLRLYSSVFHLMYGDLKVQFLVLLCLSSTQLLYSTVNYLYISCLPLKLYADDTQFFVSFSFEFFPYALTPYISIVGKKTIAEVCSWMFANLLMLS